MSINNLIVIAGAGGGGKGGGAPRAAQESPNSLRSKQVANIIDLLGEGEWEGLIDGPAGIYLNDTKLFTPTTPTNDVVTLDHVDDQGSWPYGGVWNFKSVTVEWRPGTQGQAAIRTASTSGSTIAVNTPVVNATPILRTITNSNIDLAVINVQVDSLYKQNTENGDISGHYVDLKIEGRTSGGSWTTLENDRIDGKCMSPYIRSYSVDLRAIGSGPWDIRVTRVSADDADSSFHSTLTFVAINLMTRDKFRYPNSVLVSMGIDASQFTTIPNRAYDAKMQRCRVPSNYNPTTRVYTGAWDGNFIIRWTDNPAWCLYEMATNPRFGLGQYFDSTLLDKWTLYTIGQYCDQLVPNGFGGTEPRFTMNCYFQQAEEAISLMQHMASVFRGIVYYMGGLLVPVQDAPANPVYAFNTSNVVDGRFSYAGASGSAKHTVALVVWNNPELNYKQDVEYVEDVQGLATYGYKPVTIQGIGITSRGQAHRIGAWALYVEQYEADIVTFSAGLEGTGVQPGVIVEVFDPTRAGARMGGRVIGVSGSTVTFDAPIVLPVGTHTVSYIADDGSLASRNITVTAGTYAAVTLSGGASPLPSVGTLFGIETATLTAQWFRIVSIVENGKNTYEISGVAHNPNKYGYVENNLTLQTRPTSITSLVLPAITGLTFTEKIYLMGDESVGCRLMVSWDLQPYALGYLISWRKGLDNWSTEKLITANEATFNPVADGWTYGFRITPISSIGTKGAQTEATYTILGEKTPPPPFDYFTVVAQPDGTRQFDFGYTTTPKPVDFKGARIRYYQGVTTDWDVMLPLENEGFYPFSPLETNLLFSGTYTIAARAEDRTKNLSTPTFITVTLPDRRLGNILDEFDDKVDGWPGTKTSCHIDVLANSLEIDDSTTWATLPSTWTAWTRWNFAPASSMVYTSAVHDMLSSVAGILDVTVDCDGNPAVQMRTSADNITWSAWGSASSPFTARYFQVRVTITPTGPAPVPSLRQFKYTVGGKVKKETINDVNITTVPVRTGVGDIRIPIANTYAAISRVTVMAIQDANPGWTWLLVDKSTSGPRIKFYKNGVLADPALVDFYIEGY